MEKTSNFSKWFVSVAFIVLVIVTIFDIYNGIYSNIFLNIIWIMVLLIFIFLLKKSKIPLIVYIFLCLLVILAALGEFYFYNHILFFDKVVHFFSQLIICPLIFCLAEDKIENKKILILFCITVAITLSVAWEITEYGLDNLFDGKLQGAYLEKENLLTTSEKQYELIQEKIDDTMSDLIFNLLGSCTFGVIYLLKYRKKSISR